MTGITGFTRGSAVLSKLPDTPPGEVWRYGGGSVFQVAQRKAACFCGIWVEGKGNIDYVNGSDLILFDDLSSIRSDNAIPLSRNENGESSVTVKGSVGGGFVPLGARLSEGSPHPHAGTGFGCCYALRYLLDQGGHFDFRNAEEEWLEFFHFAYDGKEFRILKKERSDWRTLFPDWYMVGPGLTDAIPDGRDFLFSMTAKAGDGLVEGVSRWRVGEDGWRPISFVPVTGRRPGDKGRWVCGGEPSLVRDVDGSLLFSARSAGEANYDMAVWRSADNGETWEQIIYRKECRSRSPVSINRAVDGTPYLAANLPPKSREREILCIWPLNRDRTDFEEPIIARDAPAEFGPAPSGSWWRVDHPRSTVVQLADGAWHDVMVYQIADNMEIEGSAEMTPQTGHYVEEGFSRGEAIPAWQFQVGPTDRAPHDLRLKPHAGGSRIGS